MATASSARPILGLRSPVFVCAAIAIGTMSWFAEWRPDANAFALAVAAYAVLVLGVWTIDTYPKPHIDAWVWHNEALRASFAGKNPYAITMPNIYRHTGAYSLDMVLNGRVLLGFQYPPVSLYRVEQASVRQLLLLHARRGVLPRRVQRAVCQRGTRASSRLTRPVLDHALQIAATLPR